MTSQNNTPRCAASTMYSMAGPNTPSGAVNAPIEDGCAWLDGMALLPACSQPAREGQRACRSFVCAAAVHPVRSDGLLSKAHAWTAGVWRREAIRQIRDRC